MSANREALTAGEATTLPDLGVRSISLELGLVALAAVVLPAGSHLAGLPVRLLLPMHWAVILGGLVYGGRAGFAIGALAPCVSFVVSGMPLPHILPAMTVELGAYGFLAGFARQCLRWNPFASAALALVGGRLVFFATALATGAALPGPIAYLGRAMLPGLPAAVVQMLTLPLLARWWVNRGRSR